MTFLEQINKEFDVKEVDIREYSPLTLAFIGDCVFDLIIRSIVVERANQSPEKLHRKKSNIVKASTQSAMAIALSEAGVFDEKESDIYRRGRNAKSYSSAKNASIADYRKATGIEAVMGYLYLTGNSERAVELTKKGLELVGLSI